ncbi:MAG: hypothetical protein AAF961_07445 [Planctomycetota bacterium]
MNQRVTLLSAVLALTSPIATVCDAATIVLENATAGLSPNPQAIEVDIYYEATSEGDFAAAFQFELAIHGPDDLLSFVGAARPAGRPYVFPNNPTGPFFEIEDGGATILVGDFLDQGESPLSDGVGFVTLELELESAVERSVYEIAFVDGNSASFVADGAGTLLPIGFSNGMVTSVPEPGGIAFLLAALTGAFLRNASLFWRHRDPAAKGHGRGDP